MSTIQQLKQHLSTQPTPTFHRPGAPIPVQPWTDVLLRVIERPKGFHEHIYHSSEEFVTVYDGFPKAKVHLLVCPRKRILKPGDLTPDDLPMLMRMSEYCRWVVGGLQQSHPDLIFRCGIHGAPSLRQLHVHVISQDFLSPCLKNAKHYLSFLPPFFVPLAHVTHKLEEQKRTGKQIEFSSSVFEGYLKGYLVCNRCYKSFGRQFAKLKDHLPTCELTVTQTHTHTHLTDLPDTSAFECASSTHTHTHTHTETSGDIDGPSGSKDAATTHTHAHTHTHTSKQEVIVVASGSFESSPGEPEKKKVKVQQTLEQAFHVPPTTHTHTHTGETGGAQKPPVIEID